MIRAFEMLIKYVYRYISLLFTFHYFPNAEIKPEFLSTCKIQIESVPDTPLGKLNVNSYICKMTCQLYKNNNLQSNYGILDFKLKLPNTKTDDRCLTVRCIDVDSCWTKLFNEKF